jgi:hypothetical protein
MKTAVEWLMEELPKHGSGAVRTFGDLFEQAKEMEKEQILDAHIKGHNAPSSTIKNWDAEQYYNETFKQQEQ